MRGPHCHGTQLCAEMPVCLTSGQIMLSNTLLGNIVWAHTDVHVRGVKLIRGGRTRLLLMELSLDLSGTNLSGNTSA